MPSNQPQDNNTQTALPPVPTDASGMPQANPLPLPVVAKDGKKDAKGQKAKPAVGFEKVLRSYLVPLGVLAIFGAILIFLVIPKIGELIDQLDQTNQLYDKARTLDSEVQSLSNLTISKDTFTTDLQLIDQIAPSGATEVVNFQKKILGLTAQDNLNVEQSSLQESVKKSQDKTSVTNLGIIEIPSTFTLRGKFADLKSFISQIKSLTDFVIIGEMSLRSNVDPNTLGTSAGSASTGSSDDWTLIITLIKYQFLEANAQNQLKQVYQGISPDTAIDQKVVDFAAAKYANSQASQTTTDQTTTDQTASPTFDLSGGTGNTTPSTTTPSTTTP